MKLPPSITNQGPFSSPWRGSGFSRRFITRTSAPACALRRGTSAGRAAIRGARCEPHVRGRWARASFGLRGSIRAACRRLRRRGFRPGNIGRSRFSRPALRLGDGLGGGVEFLQQVIKPGCHPGVAKHAAARFADNVGVHRAAFAVVFRGEARHRDQDSLGLLFRCQGLFWLIHLRISMRLTGWAGIDGSPSTSGHCALSPKCVKRKMRVAQPGRFGQAARHEIERLPLRARHHCRRLCRPDWGIALDGQPPLRRNHLAGPRHGTRHL